MEFNDLTRAGEKAMNAAKERTLDDLYFDLSMVEPAVRIEFLDQLARTYPQHARDLTEFAVELAFDDLNEKETIAPEVDDSDPIVVAEIRENDLLQNVPVPTLLVVTALAFETLAQAATAFQIDDFGMCEHGCLVYVDELKSVDEEGTVLCRECVEEQMESEGIGWGDEPNKP